MPVFRGKLRVYFEVKSSVVSKNKFESHKENQRDKKRNTKMGPEVVIRQPCPDLGQISCFSSQIVGSNIIMATFKINMTKSQGGQKWSDLEVKLG